MPSSFKRQKRYKALMSHVKSLGAMGISLKSSTTLAVNPVVKKNVRSVSRKLLFRAQMCSFMSLVKARRGALQT
jgi:hypothetical protein